MDAFPAAERFPSVSRVRHFPHQLASRAAPSRTRLACGISALLLIVLAGSALLFVSAGSQMTAALAATTCPIDNLPPTPTSGGPLDSSTIKLNEVLTNPKKDWNCDGKSDASDQWIELINISGNDESLFGLQLESQGQTVLLSSTARIGAHSYLVIFGNQIPTLPLSRGSGQIELLDGSGAVVDAVNYPALELDQSYARNPDGAGQWQQTSTPTPGAANSFTSGSTPTPKATATRRSDGGGGGSAPTATPTPFGSVFIPTNTPSGVALQNSSGSSADGGAGGAADQGIPSWLKIALIALIGIALLGVVIWYLRAWNQEPEGDN